MEQNREPRNKLTHMVKGFSPRVAKTYSMGKGQSFFSTNDGKKTGYAHAENKAGALRYAHQLKRLTRRRP